MIETLGERAMDEHGDAADDWPPLTSKDAQALPGKERWGDECCFCGAKRMRTTHARRDVKHGDRFDVWEQVTEDEEVTGAIKVQIEVDTSKLTRRASLELGDDETVAEFIRRVSQEIEDLTP